MRFTTSLEEMSEKPRAQESFMDCAKEQESLYNWLGAAETYSVALKSTRKTELQRIGDILERRAYALHKAAFQSDNHEQFRERVSMSIECYRGASESLQKIGGRENDGRKLRCDGMIKYLGFWHTSRLEEKKTLANEAWSIAKEALDVHRSAEDAAEFCRTYCLLSSVAFRVIDYVDDPAVRTAIIKSAMEYGQFALDHVGGLGDPDVRALVLVRASAFTELCSLECSGAPESLKNDLAARDLWEKAMAISEEIALQETVSFCYLPSATDANEAERVGERALEVATKVNDRLVLGNAFDWIAQRVYWGLPEARDLDELESIATRGHDLCLRAQKEHAILGYLPARIEWAWSPFPDPWHYAHVSSFVSEPKRKRSLAEKSLAAEPKFNELAFASGYPDVVCDGNMMLSIAMTSLAKTEQNLEKKKELLETAFAKGAAQQEKFEQLHPFHYGALSSNADIVAITEFELANMEADPDLKSQRLKNALRRREKGIELGERLLQEISKPRVKLFMYIGMFWNLHGTYALKLYETTSDKKDLEIAIHSFEMALEYLVKSEEPSRLAEGSWQLARAYDLLGEHQKSHHRFSQAAGQYKEAAARLPRLAVFYQDHSKYMEAWGEIELAKLQHIRQEYVTAGEHYGKAADLLASTERWRFLAVNFSAWSSLEKAEGFSRTEKSREAVRAFDEARKSFEESRTMLRSTPSDATSTEEIATLTSLAKAADSRRDYCGARTLIEEAVLLDRQGKESDSSEKYKQAADMLENTRSMLEVDREKDETALTIALARAWQMQKSAEAEVSPELFGEASQLFENVKSLSQTEKARSLALGHSRFCKALEAGMKFSDTAEASLYAEATRYLESAAKYYLKADHLAASEYANASKLLFDSYVYMDRANREEDQGAKAKLYKLAEKVLEASAVSYDQAEYPGKKEQVLKLLAKVKRDRQLAISLAEALRAPDVDSRAAGFVAPMPVHEMAAGLERFEHADIQATFAARPRDLHVGEEISLEIELVNAGRGAAQLTKVEEIIPRGFDVLDAPARYRIEDGRLDLRGRRLDALKTEEVRLVVRPRMQGRFALKPRITYVDDEGNYKSIQPESVEISVKEMGISGWLRGPDWRK